MAALFRVCLRLAVVMLAVLAAAVVLAGILAPQRQGRDPQAAPRDDRFRSAVARIDEAFHSQWVASYTELAAPAPPLAIARRLSLGLVGATPSLEEIRLFESWPADERVERYVDLLLADRRMADYLAERLARTLVGDEEGPFLVYRRRRFVNWISDTLAESSDYGALIREVLTSEGLWTDNPAVNFVTATIDEASGQPDPELLAVRVSRALVGVRLDCAQCHDHPFDERWRQEDFQSLASFFSGAGFAKDAGGLRGVTDAAPAYVPQDYETQEPRDIQPTPPFDEGLLGDARDDVPPRTRLAQWITHPENKAFARVTVNRFWALLVGEPLVAPLDDLPLDDAVSPTLDALADEFALSGYDWRRLVRLIAASKFYALDSRGEATGGANLVRFPLTRLRGEQVAGAIAQSTRLTTIDDGLHILVQLARFASQSDFLERYGDAGAQELEPAGGSLTQRLLLMNGEWVDEQTEPNLVTNAATRIAALAPNDQAAIETAYLAVLTRRPTAAESEHFQKELQGVSGDQRARRMADMYWALLNSTEFAWNH